MSRINVLVAATPSDLEADGIAAAVARHVSMMLIDGQALALDMVEARLLRIPSSEPSALVLVGNHPDAKELARRLLSTRADLVVLRVDVVDHLVQLAQYATRDKSLELQSLLAALCDLAANAGDAPARRLTRVVVHSHASRASRPLLNRAIEWIHAVLRNSAHHQTGNHGDFPGLTLTANTISALLDQPPLQAAPPLAPDVQQADEALSNALHDADSSTEPLAAAVNAFSLTGLEFRLLLLAMAPELDLRYQRCIGMLLDDLGRRVGSLALFTSLLGEPLSVRRQLAESANLARWRALETRYPGLPAADEALRLDPPLLAWLLGEQDALDTDPAVRRALRLAAWPGASLFKQQQDRQFARQYIDALLAQPDHVQCILFSGESATWCAMLEVGAAMAAVAPLRIEAARLNQLDAASIEESALRLGRMARLTSRPILVDANTEDPSPQADDALRTLLACLAGTGCRTAVVCTEPARVVRLLGAVQFTLVDRSAIRPAVRLANVRAATEQLGVNADASVLNMLARQYPLDVDGMEHALRLAQARTGDGMERFIHACQYVAAEGVSRLAECIDPIQGLGEVILPSDRARQLDEIVNSVRLATRVLEDWRFGEQLPFGRGVTALFYGASGTGKTMAAIGIAQRLNIRLLRVDLSRIVSKYIGETEKNIDRIFLDAHRSGAAILIDEAEALLGKRSEVKDAHDRYANIEVAYLLQRMETYQGLAILTTNLRQNLDAAFLRRLRFVIDFPRPDAESREKIWRRCLPDGSHTLSDAAFRHLSRKIDMTGGHIRQITLRAAFLAAASDALIALPHIAHATSAELSKLGMAGIDLELPGDRLAA